MPEDIVDDDCYDEEDDVNEENNEMPVMKTREQPKEDKDDASNVKLTKSFAMSQQFVPGYSGGVFKVLSDEKHALSLNDNKICIIDLSSGKVRATFEHENEEIVTFCLPPNE